MGYKESRELGKNKKQKECNKPFKEETEINSILDILNTEVEQADVEGKFFWLNAYTGTAKNGTIVQSDLYGQMDTIEKQLNVSIVGLVILNDGSIQLLFEK